MALIRHSRPDRTLPKQFADRSCRRILAGKHLGRVLEALEFQRVTRGIQQKHRCLLSDLALESDSRFDDEAHALSPEPLRQPVPFRPFKDHPEVPHRHIMAIDRTGLTPGNFIGREVSHDLVTVKIEIDPPI